jgi:hypothetical protein
MSEPSDEEFASRDEKASRQQGPEDARRLRKREYNRHYRERHPEQNAAIRRRWVEGNRDRIRESNRRWRAENIERARQLNRDAAHRAVLRGQRACELQARSRERARLWRQGHLEEVRSYHAQWVTKNSEKIRKYSTRYYEAHRDDVKERSTARRDANPERAKEWRKAWAERNKDRLAELQRERRKDPKIYQGQLEANAAVLRSVTAAERRAHEQAAEAYFSDPSLAEHVRQSAVFTETLTAHLRDHGPQMREFAAAYCASRARLGLSLVEVDDVMYARAVEVVLADLQRAELLTSRDIAGAIRSSRAVVQREERDRQFDHLLRTLIAHTNSQRHRLELDVEMENRARAQRGFPHVQSDALLVQLALQDVVERVPTSQLTIANIRGVCRAAKARVVGPFDACAHGASQIAAKPSRSTDTLQ